MPNDNENDIFHENGSPIEDIPHEHDEAYEHDETHEVPYSESPAEKPAKKKAAFYIAVLIGAILVSLVGYKGYSLYERNQNQEDGGFRPSGEPPSTPLPNPYEPEQSAPSQIPVAPPVDAPIAEPVKESGGEQATPSAPAKPVSMTTPKAPEIVPPQTTPAPTISTESISSKKIEDTALEKKVEELNARVASLELKITQKIAASRKENSSVMAPRSFHKNTEIPSKAPTPKAEKPLANSKYQIMSVIVGQAWIENKLTGAVEIVRTGESLSDGTKITGINAVHNEVLTNRGTITGE